MARITHLNLMHRGSDGMEMDADDLGYDNGVSGLTATELQAAVDELAATLGTGVPRRVHDLLQNKSGGTVNAGDVVILDSANDNAFKTTTTAALETSIGVVEDASIANNANGYVITYGFAPIVNTNAVSATRGHYLFTSTSAKVATASATRAAGAFGQVIETGADPVAWLWGPADSAGHLANSVRKNSTGSTFTRTRLNLIEGSNVTLTVADDGANDEVDVTIAAATSGGTVVVEELDGAPTGTFDTIKFPNGTVTDNGDGSVTVVAGGLTDHTHAATGSGANGGGNALDVNAGTLRIPVGTGALTTTEGYTGWQSTTERLRLYDGQRERGISEVGWVPFAYPISFVPTAAFTTAVSLVADGGAIAIPMWVPGHMLLESASWRNTDTSLQRTVDWSLYEQRLNDGNSGENTLDRVATSAGQLIYTASAASIKAIDMAAPVYIPPGIYWLVIQNQHATNTYGIGSTAASSAFAQATAQTKGTGGNPIGSTLNLVTGWTRVTAVYAARLHGRVFGETAYFQ